MGRDQYDCCGTGTKGYVVWREHLHRMCLCAGAHPGVGNTDACMRKGDIWDPEPLVAPTSCRVFHDRRVAKAKRSIIRMLKAHLNTTYTSPR